MIFKTIYKSNDHYATLKDLKENSLVTLTSKASNLSKLSKAHFMNVDDQNFNLVKTTQSIYLKIS